MAELNYNAEALGKKLARDVWDDEGKLLLPKGTELTPSYMGYIMRTKLRNVYIIDEFDQECSIEIGSSAGVSEPAPPEPVREDQAELSRAFHHTVDSFKSMMHRVASGHAIAKAEVAEAVDYMFPAISKSSNVLYSLQNLRTRDDYTFEHSVAVCVISLKIGQIMGFDDNKLKSLGMAGLLHDIGKARIPMNILQKPDRLTDDEYKEIKKHPVYGYRIVQDMNFEDRDIEYGVFEHHERHDGGGYPIGIEGDKIHEYAKIIAVADVFDAITSDRAYRPRFGLLQAVEEICSRDSGYLDSRIAERFIKYILNVSPGDKVILSTGETAIILMVNDDEPLRPLVKAGERFIDLKEDRSISIENRL